MENKKHILVVDDEEANIFMFEGILSNEGFDVSTAKNGIECLEMVRSIPNVDIILLDIMMPEMSGIEVLTRLKNHRQFKDIPVIMISALTDAESIKNALSKGAIEYIKKPLDEIELIARIETVLKIKRQEDELKESLKVKDDFIRMVAHDLKRPFSTISGYSQVLLDDKKLSKHLNSEQEEILQYINNSSFFIIDYFNKMLAWTNLGQRKLILDIENVNLKEIINNIEKMFQSRIRDKKMSLITKIVDMDLDADKTYLTHAISNIVSNAIKFTPEFGKINIFTSEEDSKMVLNISDTGEGLKHEKQLLLTSKFVKPYEGTNGEKGTGTGLYVCRKILEAHGYGMELESEIGNGTTVKIHFYNGVS